MVLSESDVLGDVLCAAAWLCVMVLPLIVSVVVGILQLPCVAAWCVAAWCTPVLSALIMLAMDTVDQFYSSRVLVGSAALMPCGSRSSSACWLAASREPVMHASRCLVIYYGVR